MQLLAVGAASLSGRALPFRREEASCGVPDSMVHSCLQRMEHGVSREIGLWLAGPCSGVLASYCTCRCILCRDGTAMGFYEGLPWAMRPHGVGVCLLE